MLSFLAVFLSLLIVCAIVICWPVVMLLLIFCTITWLIKECIQFDYKA